MTKHRKAVITAHKKGYRVLDDGRVVSSKGKIRQLSIQKRGNDQRLTFTVATQNGTYPVPVHRLLAFQKYGETLFETGTVVRHLDGNPLNNKPDNIAIGTIRDNAMDRPHEERQLHAQKGTRGKGLIDEFMWGRIRSDHEGGMGYKKLRAKYGASLSTLSYRLSKTSSYRLLENR